MKSIKFIDLLKSTNDEQKKLKLIFNSDWDYDPKNLPEYVKKKLGRVPMRFDLLDLYTRNNKNQFEVD
jgi:hypothetical protein